MIKLLVSILSLSFLMFSCSLNYLNSENTESSIPELTFTNATFSRYESNRTTMQMSAEKIEQYKTDGSTYAKKAEFKTFDDDGKLETEGKCDIVSADTKNDVYILFGNIYVNMYPQKMKLFANSLNFNKKSEQIISGYEDEVSIERDDIIIKGKGFRASGVSKSFSFDESVSGTITTE